MNTQYLEIDKTINELHSVCGLSESQIKQQLFYDNKTDSMTVKKRLDRYTMIQNQIKKDKQRLLKQVGQYDIFLEKLIKIFLLEIAEEDLLNVCLEGDDIDEFNYRKTNISINDFLDYFNICTELMACKTFKKTRAIINNTKLA